MKILYNNSMAKSKSTANKKGEVAPVGEIKLPPKSPFSGFSRFGGPPNRFGGPKFNPKGIVVRPTFVTQHKGGGGK
jgi:hypothetical protein